MATYVTDLYGKSGMALLEALVNGEVLEAEDINKLVYSRLKKKVPELVEACNGRVRAHHRFMIGRHLEHLHQVEEHIEVVEGEIERLLTPYREEIEKLKTIPGIQEDAAASILAEVGTDMSVFPTENHVASWAGLCPASNESAGKKRSSKTNKGNKGLKAVLCQVAWAAAKTKNTRVGAFYNRVMRQRGPKKAAIATAHLILKIGYVMLRDKTTYQELGAEYLPRKEKGLDYWVSKIKSMGYSIHLQDAPMY